MDKVPSPLSSSHATGVLDEQLVKTERTVSTDAEVTSRVSRPLTGATKRIHVSDALAVPGPPHVSEREGEVVAEEPAKEPEKD